MAFKAPREKFIAVPEYLSMSSTKREKLLQGDSGSLGSGPQLNDWLSKGVESFQVVVFVKKAGIREPKVESCRNYKDCQKSSSGSDTDRLTAAALWTIGSNPKAATPFKKSPTSRPWYMAESLVGNAVPGKRMIGII